MSAMVAGRSSVRRLAVPLLGGAISLAALIVALQGIDLPRTLAQLRDVRPGPLAVAAAALVVQLGVRSVRWSYLLQPGPAGRVPGRRLVPIVLIGYLGNAVLPARLGDPVRAVLVGRREAVPASSAFGSVVLERAIDTLTLALIALPAAAIAGAPGWAVRTALLVTVVAGAVVVIAQTALPGAAVAWVEARTRPRWRPWVAGVDRFVRAMNGRGRLRALVAAGGLSLVAWVDLAPAGAMFVAAITVLGTAIPSAPGYLGTFELAASAAARSLGIAPEPALAFALLVHAMTVLPLAIGGAVSLVWVGVRFGDLTGAARAAGEETAAPVAPGQVT
jgi:uncharacterized membrane protein YbhN (UPF0104 family)